MTRYRGTMLASAVVLTALVTACGGGGGSVSMTPINPYNPTDDIVKCVPGSSVIGVWRTVANNQTVMPDSPQLPFFSYNQPSINATGMVVFRGRAKSASGGGGDSGMQRGIYAADLCPAKLSLYTVADSSTTVPSPNNTGAAFTEFPSIPRIDSSSGLIATRGQSDPVWTLPDGTKVGTSGVYVSLPSGLATGVGLLGSIADFAYMQVPGASTAGVRFDQFPGSPAVSDGKYLVFKGNYTDGTSSKTGIYYRDLGTTGSPVTLIADSNTPIPGASAPTPSGSASSPAGSVPVFGSTAPPSAADNHVVFVGLDNESAPTMGGIYLAPIADRPTLTPLVEIGKTPVPDSTGSPLPAPAGSATAPVFTLLGEGLAFDGRYVAFWGAWGTGNGNAGMHQISVTCPTDGNKQLVAACMAGSTKDSNGQPTGNTPEWVPDNQGIFVVDSSTGKVWMVARAANDNSEAFGSLLYWTYSGAPPAPGSAGPTDAEPPHWRASAFAAVDGNRGVIFKGSLAGTTGPSSGIYGAALTSANGAVTSVGPVFKVVAVGDPMGMLDPASPAGSTVTSLGIERESLRNGWLTLTASSIDPAGEGWAGVYATYFPNGFHVGTPAQAGAMPDLILGN